MKRERSDRATPNELLERLEERFILGEIDQKHYEEMKARLMAKLGAVSSGSSPGADAEGYRVGTGAWLSEPGKSAMPTARTPDVTITLGEMIGEQFRVEAVLGRGALGFVYKVFDTVLERARAIKVVFPDPVRAETAFKQLVREFETRERIRDFAHILRTDSPQLCGYQGQKVIVLPMPLAEKSMRDWIKQRPDRDEKEAYEAWLDQTMGLFRQSCEGVKEIHDCSLIHLDLKPENILLVRDGKVLKAQVADFGLARTQGQGGNREAGTLAYMSPEQFNWRPKDIGPESDVYALGCILFEIIDGAPPFEGDTLEEYRRMHSESEPPMYRWKHVRPEWQDVVRRCLSKRPADRFKTAGDLLSSGPMRDALTVVVQELHDCVDKRVLQEGDPYFTCEDCGGFCHEENRVQHPYGERLNLCANCGQKLVAPLRQQKQAEDAEKARLESERLRLQSRREGPDPGARRRIALPGGQELVLCWCPPGEFIMGSPEQERGEELDRFNPEDRHLVRITEGFWIGMYPVTQDQWKTVMGSNPSGFPGAGPDAPVEQVSWEECRQFIDALNSCASDSGFRLPTEAEWEYACRAGSTQAFCFGDSETELAEYAWYRDNSGWTTHPVGKKRPNAWGLHDMHGNVVEWCSDWYAVYPQQNVTDPTGPDTVESNVQPLRIMRGGTHGYFAAFCRSACRACCDPKQRSNDWGFRVVLSSQRKGIGRVIKEQRESEVARKAAEIEEQRRKAEEADLRRQEEDDRKKQELEEFARRKQEEEQRNREEQARQREEANRAREEQARQREEANRVRAVDHIRSCIRNHQASRASGDAAPFLILPLYWEYLFEIEAECQKYFRIKIRADEIDRIARDEMRRRGLHFYSRTSRQEHSLDDVPWLEYSGDIPLPAPII